MKITFLIGNGFDINLGLKTQYTDFYDTYIESNKDLGVAENIKKFCGLIENNYKTWSDFEMAFASNAFGTKQDVRDILYDFSTKFSEYLVKQTQLCNYDDKGIPEKFKDFLVNGYKHLEDNDRQIIDDKYNVKEDFSINFINFNYTDTLDMLIKTYKRSKSGSDIIKEFSISPKYYHRLGKVINIHGTLKNYIIIAIDSIEQLSDNNLKNDPNIAKYCVKSKINADNGNIKVENDFIDMINSSSIIYAYGIAFGESDKSRWGVVKKWLEASSGHKLIIYKFGADFKKHNGIYRRMRLDAIEESKDEYLNKLGFDKSEYEAYYNQIFVIDSADVLKFKLIPNDPGTKEDDENALAVST